MKWWSNKTREQKEDVFCEVASWVLFIGMCVLLGLCLGSCRTIHDVEKVYIEQHDTLALVVNQRDSIFVHDSVFLATNREGDTVFVTKEKWHTKYVDRLQHDSIYIAKTDTIYREKVIEKKPTWWQSIKQSLGGIAVFALLIMLALFLVKRWYK